MPRVVAVRPLRPYSLWLRFADGREGIVDLADLFASGGVFEHLREEEAFRRVRVEPEFGTIEWPGVVDLDPIVLYARLSGQSADEILSRG